MAKSSVANTKLQEIQRKVVSIIAAAAGNPTIEVIETRAANVRELIFQAQAIIQLAARAAMADDEDWTMKNSLGSADKMLDEAAELLSPPFITSAAAEEVSHG